MYILQFKKYFRPHVKRLLWATLFMVLVSIFSAVNLLAAKPLIGIIIGEVTLEEYQAGRAERAARNQTARTGIGQWWEERIAPVREKVDQQVERFYRYAEQRENKIRAMLYLSLVLLVFTLIKAFSEYYSKYLMSFSLYSVTLQIKEDLFAHIMHQDAAFFQTNTTGYLESRLNSDIKNLHKIFDALIRDAVQQPLIIASLLVVLCILSWQLTIIAMVVLPLAAIPLAYFSRKLRKITHKSQRQTDVLFSFAEEALRNYRLVKVYDSVDFEVERFRKKNTKLLYYFLRQRVANFAQSPVMEVMGTIGAIGVLLYGGMQILSDEPTMKSSDFLVYLVALTMFYSPIRKLTKINVYWQEGRVSADRIQEMFRIEKTIAEKPDALPLERIERGLTFEKMAFCYDQTPVIEDIDLEIPLGKVVAIVGKSGAGKSTLANLIPRLFDPTDGRYLIDGRPAGDYRISDLRRRFGVVTQETILFNDTVARNIAYAEAETAIDPERLVQAARQAHAHDFILALEGGLGYQTVIGQSGARLSGGQRQRLAIARAIYRNPQILIFDEATSALDEESQRHVQAAMDNLLKDRTAIVIAHRLSTVRNADLIIVMDKGHIVERGSHDALIDQGGMYSLLYQQGDL